VKDRIGAVNSVLKEDNRRLTVDPQCKKLIDGLRKHTYKEGTRQPEKGQYDHFNDALGYMVNNIYPIKQNTRSPGGPIRRNTGGYI